MRSTDEVYGSVAYDGAQLLRVPLCVSWAFLVDEVTTDLLQTPSNGVGGLHNYAHVRVNLLVHWSVRQKLNRFSSVQLSSVTSLCTRLKI